MSKVFRKRSLAGSQPQCVQLNGGEVVGEQHDFETHLVDCLWEWQHGNGWSPCDAPICNQLERAFRTGNPRCVVSVGSENYDVNFTHMWQQNISTRTTRQLRRSTWGEAPTWYWWGNDGRNRLQPEATTLLEQEYQKIMSGAPDQPREVTCCTGEGATFIANFSNMQLKQEGGRLSYPISRCLIKASSVHVAAEGEADYREGPNQEESVEVPPQSATGEASDSSRIPTRISTEADSEEKRPHTSLQITFQNSSVRIHLLEGRAATIDISQSPKKAHGILQVQNDKASIMTDQLCLCARSEEPLCCCCCCSSHKGGCRHHDWRVAFCDRCTCSSCSHSCGGCNQGRNPCSHEATCASQGASSCSVEQLGDSHLKEVAPEKSCFGHAVCTQQQGEQHQQKRGTGLSPALRSQQQFLQNSLELQENQFLLRQEMHLTRQIQLEQQQEKLHLQQQQLVHELRQQQDELIQKQAEVREQQLQLEQKLAEQGLVSLQQARILKQLQSLASPAVADLTTQCGEQKREDCSEAEKDVNRGQLSPKDSSSPAVLVPKEVRGTPRSLETYLSPENEESIREDEYTCL